MDYSSSTFDDNKNTKNTFYKQQDLFNYWNARFPAQVKVETTTTDYSSNLYLDLFDPLFGLNKEQITLLHSPENIIAVNSVPGTGKSAMLTTLAAYWIKQKKYKPGEILLLTLTEQETAFLRHSLEAMVGEQCKNFVITTFEKLCFQILAGKNSRTAKLYNSKERRCFISLVFPFLNSNEIDELSTYIGTYDEIHLTQEKELEEMADAYLSSLEKIGAYDRATLISQTYKYLTGNPGVLAHLKHKFPAILVDDFQDMNAEKYKIFALLINDDLLYEEELLKKRKIIIFNDHYQALNHQPARENPLYYKFLDEFAEKEIHFSKNCRSQRQILASANKLLKKINKRGKHKIVAAFKKGAELAVYQVEHKQAEADLISEVIQSYLQDDSNQPGDIAIIYKDAKECETLFHTLKGMPLLIHSADALIHRAPFSHIFSLFNFMQNPKDITSLADIFLNVTEHFKISDVQSIFLAGNRKEESLPMLVNRLYSTHQLTENQYKCITDLFVFVKNLKNTLSNLGIADALELIMTTYKKIDLRGSILDTDYQILFSRAHQYEQNLTDFIQSFYFSRSEILLNYKKERIHLIPLPLCKGMDFKVVFITGLEEGKFPCYTTDLNLEYRLFYIALTRAREQVILTSVRNQDDRHFSISSFIADLGLNTKIKSILPKSDSATEDTASGSMEIFTE